MALDNRYIAASDLELYLVDKTTGLPLANGTVEFYCDVNRAILKPVYTISGTAPNYSFVQLPNPSTLSAVGTFQDAGQSNVIPYYFPYDADGDTELYYIVVRDQAGVVQFTREAWPPNVDNGSGGDTANSTNYIPNGQFLAHTDVPEDDENGIPFGQITQDETKIAQGGWYFNQPAGTTSVNNVQFFRYGEFLSNPEASPRYAVQITSNTPDATDAFKDLRLRFEDVNKFSSDDAEYTITFTANTFNSGAFDLTLDLIKYFGTGGSPSATTVTTLTQFNITNTETKFQLAFTFGSNEGEGIGTNNDDYVELAFSAPVNIPMGFQATDFALFAGNLSSPSFPQTTQRDFMSRSLTPPTPTPDGSDLYLPIVLTQEGYGYDSASIGIVEGDSGGSNNFNGSLSTTSNLMKADGAQYFAGGHSDLGIPFSRLQSKYFNTSLQQPIYGTGLDFVSTYITSIANNLFLGTNQVGLSTSPADVDTGFIFFENAASVATDYGLTSYQSSGNKIIAIANTAGYLADIPTAGTSGFTIEVIKNTQNVDTPLTFSIETTDATTLEDTYFTFETLPGDVEYYMWFTVDGAGTDPAPGGTGIEVALELTNTAEDVAAIVNFALSGKQANTISTTAGAALVGGEHFTFGATNANNYYAWYTVDGVGTDPIILGSLGIEVAVLSADLDSDVAFKTMAAINRTFFAAPDLRGVFLRGVDPTSKWDLDADLRIGVAPTVYGNQIGTFELDSVGSHNHQYIFRATQFPQTGSSTQCWSGSSNANTEDSGGVETRPVNNYVEWLIRY